MLLLWKTSIKSVKYYLSTNLVKYKESSGVEFNVNFLRLYYIHIYVP